AAATREVRAAAKACACQIIEQSGSSSDCTTGACLAKLRSETGCDLVLATLVRRDGADLTVQLRLVDAIRGDVIHTAMNATDASYGIDGLDLAKLTASVLASLQPATLAAPSERSSEPAREEADASSPTGLRVGSRGAAAEAAPSRPSTPAAQAPLLGRR